jgi:selenide,water dikinase
MPPRDRRGERALALVQTVDFFTPIVDDPFDWGRIAAANALSDVYAMGGRPLTALNIVAWPVEELPLEMLARVLEGGQAVVASAGATVVGGHSIHDAEPKYGLAVTGLVDPDRIVRNSEMRPGDRLFLTKPLGLGIISTAIKADAAPPAGVERAVQVMTALNAAASDAMVAAGVVAATDVTGFGLLGHLRSSLAASGASAVVRADRVPLIKGTVELANAGMIPSGTRANRDFISDRADWGELSDIEQLVLADAQTSGGMLIAASPPVADRLLSELSDRGVDVAEIGAVEDGAAGTIRIGGRVEGWMENEAAE